MYSHPVTIDFDLAHQRAPIHLHIQFREPLRCGRTHRCFCNLVAFVVHGPVDDGSDDHKRARNQQERHDRNRQLETPHVFRRA